MLPGTGGPAGQRRKQLAAAMRVGPHTLVRSVYHSLRRTGRLDSLVVGSRALCEFSRDATIDVEPDARLLFATGDKRFGASHPKLGRSKFEITENGRVHVRGGNARIGPCSVIHVDGEFSIGASYVNSHARILCSESITIGNGCSIAWNVEFLDDDRHRLTVDGDATPARAPIRVKDNVWIGNNVLVKKGVTIGEGAVVGSGSVVTDNIPERTLATGQPAEVIRHDVEWQ